MQLTVALGGGRCDLESDPFSTLTVLFLIIGNLKSSKETALQFIVDNAFDSCQNATVLRSAANELVISMTQVSPRPPASDVMRCQMCSAFGLLDNRSRCCNRSPIPLQHVGRTPRPADHCDEGWRRHDFSNLTARSERTDLSCGQKRAPHGKQVFWLRPPGLIAAGVIEVHVNWAQ